MKIKLNQIYKSIGHSQYVVVAKKKGEKWKVKILTDQPGVYKGTHTLAERTIRKCYELIN